MRPRCAPLNLSPSCKTVKTITPRATSITRLYSSGADNPNSDGLPSADLALPPSAHQPHNSISSFLRHARLTNLSPSNPTYKGTLFEYRVRDALSRHGFSLTRVGGRSDLGIDLLGWWDLPGSEDEKGGGNKMKRLRVLIQCKAIGKKPEPNLIRELEGTFAGLSHSASALQRHEHPSSSDLTDAASSTPTIALLAAPEGATKGVREALNRSSLPMGYLLVGMDTGRLGQVVWNRAAGRAGLKGLRVEVRYSIGNASENAESDRVGRELILILDGAVVGAAVSPVSRSFQSEKKRSAN